MLGAVQQQNQIMTISKNKLQHHNTVHDCMLGNALGGIITCGHHHLPVDSLWLSIQLISNKLQYASMH